MNCLAKTRHFIGRRPRPYSSYSSQQTRWLRTASSIPKTRSCVPDTISCWAATLAATAVIVSSSLLTSPISGDRENEVSCENKVVPQSICSALHGKEVDGESEMRALNSAIQSNHERQMVNMAKLLRSLESLVEESGNLTHRLTLPAKEEPKEAEVQTSSTLGKVIHITHDDLLNLPSSPQLVWAYIDKLKEGAIFGCEDVKAIVQTARDVLLADPTLIDLTKRKELKTVTVVGDLHGHFHDSLVKVLDIVSRGEGGSPWHGTGAVVFNGDFVDRGENSLEVILALLLIKIAFPDNVYLNRGNHEDSVISSCYGFETELEDRYGNQCTAEIWKEFENVFASLPLAALTKKSLIVHGGIPSASFTLDQIESISSDQRFKVKTMVEVDPDDEVAKFVQALCWSDPQSLNGVAENEDRGVGIRYGPDVIKSFLAKHDLDRLIRSHETIDEGYEILETEDGHSAITVFSAVNYPGGAGFNSGAIVKLHLDGDTEDATFESFSSADSSNTKMTDHTFKALANIIAMNRSALEEEFEYMASLRASRLQLKAAFRMDTDQPSAIATSPAVGSEQIYITREQWTDTMSFVLSGELPNIDWRSLQRFIAPGDVIDYKCFLNLHCNLSSYSEAGTLDVCQKTRDILLRNHEVLLKVFKFLDTNNDGHLDREEFRKGICEVSKHNPEISLLLGDADTLFKKLDEDSSGTIELAEFERAFQSVDVPYKVNVMLQFDKDNSGTIDRSEFREGVRLFEARQLKSKTDEDIDKLFDVLDLDGNGELEMIEFDKFLSDHYPHWCE